MTSANPHVPPPVSAGPGPSGRGRSPRARQAAGLAALVGLATVLAGCAPGVSVAEAPHGDDPTCAGLVLALPRALGDLERRTTTSQASAAWGSATAPVVLRCGVDVPGPTTTRCVTMQTASGPSIDWLAVAGTPDAQGATDWTFTTYGRDPAVEVHVPAAVTSERSTSFLDALGTAIAQVPATRSCL